MIKDDKPYGELMSFLLQRRRQHGTDDRFRAYVEESIQALARDVRDLGMDLSIEKCATRPAVRSAELNSLSVGCE
ncbi:MAG TPA: hypothetical protein VLG74_01390 [Blastocatellia bacterium]|nr:hypothetical protein [Blastocatellia bacterium]